MVSENTKYICMLCRVGDDLENLIYNQKLALFVWSQSKENCGMLFSDYGKAGDYLCYISEQNIFALNSVLLHTQYPMF